MGYLWYPMVPLGSTCAHVDTLARGFHHRRAFRLQDPCRACRMTPAMSPKDSDKEDSLELSPCGSGPMCVGFRCHHCVCIIDEGQPVYMGRDASYCSADCRKRGRSVAYAQLMGIKQVEEEVPYDSGSYTNSLVSESTTISSKKTVEPDAGPGEKRRVYAMCHRVFRWILSAGIRHLNVRVAKND
eukprot:Skav225466  [mRNA]  locus=scaffold881:219042:222732:+ [translate_table: standard]